MHNDKIIHYTDHLFQKMCNSHYGINRGVYNVIDQWFYSIGMTDVQERRKEILNFLEFVSTNTGMEKIKFGSGGLSKKFAEYKEERILCV